MGIADPSSAYDASIRLYEWSIQAPLHAMQPAIIQRIKLMPPLPAPLLTRVGVLKIPLPICWPTTRNPPLQYVTTLRCSRSEWRGRSWDPSIVASRDMTLRIGRRKLYLAMVE